MKIKLGWKAHNSTTIWSFNLTSQVNWDFFCTNLNFGLFFFWYFFFQLKRVYSKTALFILIQFFFLKYHEYKNASLVFSLSYLLSELFFLFNVFFSQLFIFKATIFIFISTWLILIFHHFLFINFIRTIFSCFFLFNILCIVSLSFNPDLYMYKYGIQYCIYV